jgi:hypothetical protein
MKKLFGIVILMFNISAYATDQAMDILIYNDTVSYIFSEELISDYHPIRGYPLEYYLWKPNRDSVHMKLVDEVFKPYRWCMRGYIAKWKIRNDSLFLIEIFYKPTVTAYVEAKPADSFPLQKLFPQKNVVNEVYADWYTGLINTVMYQSEYPPFDSDEWKDKRKRFAVREGRIIGMIKK